MLTSVQSLLSRMFGVVDIDKTSGIVKKTVVPIRYHEIIFQKYGIIAKKATGIYDAYSFEGQVIFHNVIDPVFLANNLLLVKSAQNKCYIINYSTHTSLFSKSGFDSILFFMGSNPQAIEYPAKLPLAQYFASSDYKEYGAHLENLVAVKQQNKWGVINLETETIHSDFKYSIMVQCTGSQIAAKDFDNNTFQLY